MKIFNPLIISAFVALFFAGILVAMSFSQPLFVIPLTIGLALSLAALPQVKNIKFFKKTPYLYRSILMSLLLVGAVIPIAPASVNPFQGAIFGQEFEQQIITANFSTTTGNTGIVRLIFLQPGRAVYPNESLELISESLYSRNTSLGEPALEFGVFLDGQFVEALPVCVYTQTQNQEACTGNSAYQVSTGHWLSHIPFNVSTANISGGTHRIEVNYRSAGTTEWKATPFVTDFYYEDPACIFDSQTAFTVLNPGETFSLDELRRNVKAFCHTRAIMVDRVGAVSEQRIDEYEQVMNGGFFTIPALEQWTIFWVPETLDPNLTYVSDPEGDPLPGTTFYCETGILSSVDGSCTIQVEDPCDPGAYFDVVLDKCVEQISETEAIDGVITGPPDSNVTIVTDSEGNIIGGQIIYNPDPSVNLIKSVPDTQTTTISAKMFQTDTAAGELPAILIAFSVLMFSLAGIMILFKKPIVRKLEKMRRGR